MASDDKSNQDNLESEKDKQDDLEEKLEDDLEEDDDDELTVEEENQLLKEELETAKADTEKVKKDYAGLKTDYDKNATKANKEKKAEGDDVSVEDTIDWKIQNSKKIRIAGESYKKELAFYKENGIPQTEENLERALSNALAHKGVKKVQSKDGTDQSVDTSGGSEVRKSKSIKKQKPENFIGTQEEFDKIHSEKMQRKKALGK